jgi:hypothetical protein
MPDDSRADDLEKLLSEEKAFEERKHALIADLLKQREAAMKDFDAKLAKLGYQENSSGKPKRSHHRTPAPDVAAKQKDKAKG